MQTNLLRTKQQQVIKGTKNEEKSSKKKQKQKRGCRNNTKSVQKESRKNYSTCKEPGTSLRKNTIVNENASTETEV